MTSDLEVGWKVIAWGDPPIACAVPACHRRVTSGWVRVDQQHPRRDGTPVLCADCHFKISVGVDPDPGAERPAWADAQAPREEPA